MKFKGLNSPTATGSVHHVHSMGRSKCGTPVIPCYQQVMSLAMSLTDYGAKTHLVRALFQDNIRAQSRIAHKETRNYYLHYLLPHSTACEHRANLVTSLLSLT